MISNKSELQLFYTNRIQSEKKIHVFEQNIWNITAFLIRTF